MQQDPNPNRLYEFFQKAMADREAAREAQAQAQVPRRPVEPRPNESIFGIKGKARDIMGIIGDVLSVRAGQDPTYTMQRQREKLGDLMAAFDPNDPNTLTEIMRANPELGMKMFQEVERNRLAQQKIEDDGLDDMMNNLFKAQEGDAMLARLMQGENRGPDNSYVWATGADGKPVRMKNRDAAAAGATPYQRPTTPRNPASPHYIWAVDSSGNTRRMTNEEAVRIGAKPVPRPDRRTNSVTAPGGIPAGWTDLGNGQFKTPTGQIVRRRTK